jgi:two-component system chemotaxis response regulator CheB
VNPEFRRDIIVIGGSAGALEALKSLAPLLPADLPAAIFVAVHMASDFPSYLPAILTSSGRLPALQPKERQRIRHGVIYVAPPDHHLLVGEGFVEISRGPRENRSRPAIDPLFRSAARAYGRRVLGVVLSGTLDDGSSGLMAVKIRGGLAVVQAAAEALCPEMPQRAKEYAQADAELPVAEIASLIAQVTSENLPLREPAPETPMLDEIDSEAAKANLATDANQEKIGKPSAYACPECHGVMWEVEEGPMLRFRCRVGHAYTADVLRGALSDSVEEALWAAMRSLEEKASLLRRMGARSGDKRAAEYQQEAGQFDRHVETIRQVLIHNEGIEAREKRASA